jgi:hypothetical protein
LPEAVDHLSSSFLTHFLVVRKNMRDNLGESDR